MRERLFITADDIGLSRGVTDSILEVADVGGIDGVSVIPNGEALSYTLSELEKRPALSVALHANLTEGKSLTRVPLLTTSEGYFRYSPLRLWLRYLCALPSTRALLRTQVRKELVAQHRAVGSPERVNGHQHVHMVPFVFDELIALSGVRYSRLAREPLYVVPGKLAVFLAQALPVFGLSLLAFRNRCRAAQKGVLTNDYCIGVLYSDNITESAIIAGLSRIRGAVELIVHPGSAKLEELQEWENAGSDIAWHTKHTREYEREMLMKLGFRERIMRLDVMRGKLLRFLISGAMAACVHILIFTFLVMNGLWYIAATVIGFCVAFIVSFSLQKWWTFNDYGHGRVGRQLGAYLALQLGNLLLNAAGLYFFVEIFGISPSHSLILVLAILALSTYVLSSKIFNSHSSSRVIHSHLENLTEVVSDLPMRRVLDVGAGRGAFLIDCAKRQIRAEGLEYNPANIEIARGRASEAGVSIVMQQGQAEQLPFADESFEFVNLCEVIEHVQDPRLVLAEIERVLVLGGKAYISVPSRFGWYDPHFHLFFVNWLPRHFADAYIVLRGRGKDYRGESGEQRLSQMHYYTFCAFARELRNAGFNLEDARVSKLRARLGGLLLFLSLGAYYLARPWYFRAFHLIATKPFKHV